MSPSLKGFVSAADGSNIAKQCQFDSSQILGKSVGVTAALAALSVIGTGVAHGTVNMSEAALAANAAHIEIVEPPAFMQKDSSKEYTTGYVYSQVRNEDIGSTRISDPKLAP